MFIIIIITAVKQFVKKTSDENRNLFRENQKKKRKERWQSKAMHGQHVRQTKEFAAETSCQWLKRGSLKRQTESHRSSSGLSPQH